MDAKNRAMLMSKLRQLLEADDEAAQDEIYHEINYLSPDPEWSNYVFHSNSYYDADGKLDVAAVVERMESYRPIIL